MEAISDGTEPLVVWRRGARMVAEVAISSADDLQREIISLIANLTVYPVRALFAIIGALGKQLYPINCTVK